MSSSDTPPADDLSSGGSSSPPSSLSASSSFNSSNAPSEPPPPAPEPPAPPSPTTTSSSSSFSSSLLSPSPPASTSESAPTSAASSTSESASPPPSSRQIDISRLVISGEVDLKQKLTSLSASCIIAGTNTQMSPNNNRKKKPHITYLLQVNFTDNTMYVCYRRFRVLHKLHLQLSKSFRNLPKFPPKKIMGNMNKKFVKKRRYDLEEYFKRLFERQDVRHSDILFQFLRDEEDPESEDKEPTKSRPDTPTTAATEQPKNDPQSDESDETLARQHPELAFLLQGDDTLTMEEKRHTIIVSKTVVDTLRSRAQQHTTHKTVADIFEPLASQSQQANAPTPTSTSPSSNGSPEDETKPSLDSETSISSELSDPSATIESITSAVTASLVPRSSLISGRGKWFTELMQTERIYVTRLQRVDSCFLQPLLCSGVVSLDVIIKIFKNIQVISSNSESFLEDLVTLYKNASVPVNSPIPEGEGSNGIMIGRFFLKKMLVFKMYVSYMDGYFLSNELLKTQCETNPQFNSVVKKLEQAENLKVLLLAPYQRISTYKLMLLNLLRNTEETHPDFVSLSASAEQMGDIVDRCLARWRDNEARVKVFSMMQELKLKTTHIPNHRRLVRDSLSSLHILKGSAPMPCRVVLFTDMLFVMKHRSSERFEIPLEVSDPNFKIVDLEPAQPLSFSVQSTQYTFRFKAVNEGVRDIWKKTIQERIDSLHT